MSSNQGEKDQSLAVVGGKLVSSDIQFWTFKALNFQDIPNDD